MLDDRIARIGEPLLQRASPRLVDRVLIAAIAEAVTYLLCAQLGIAGTEASVEYIQSYRGTPDTLDLSLERIRATAQRLTIKLDAISFETRPVPG